MIHVKIHFEFKTFEQQIREVILRSKKLWIEDLTKEEKKDPEKLPYAVLVKIDLYNKIREIFCNPHIIGMDTPNLYGLRIGILNENESRPFYLVDREYYKRLKGGNQDDRRIRKHKAD